MQTKAKLNSVTTTKNNKIKAPKPVKVLKDSSDGTDDETSDDDLLLSVQKSEVNNQGE